MCPYNLQPPLLGNIYMYKLTSPEFLKTFPVLKFLTSTFRGIQMMSTQIHLHIGLCCVLLLFRFCLYKCFWFLRLIDSLTSSSTSNPKGVPMLTWYFWSLTWRWLRWWEWRSRWVMQQRFHCVTGLHMPRGRYYNEKLPCTCAYLSLHNLWPLAAC